MAIYRLPWYSTSGDGTTSHCYIDPGANLNTVADINTNCHLGRDYGVAG